MAEVEDVALKPCGRVQHSDGLLGHGLPRGERHGRVEVALHCVPGPDPTGRLRQGHPEVDAHHVGSCLAHRGKQLAGADAEVDTRHVEIGDRGEHRRRVRQHVAPVVGLGQRAGPRVEQLHRRGPRLDLHPEELPRDDREPTEQ